MDGRMGEITEMRDVLIHVYFRADVRLTIRQQPGISLKFLFYKILSLDHP